MFTQIVLTEEDYSEIISQLDSLDADLGSIVNSLDNQEKVMKMVREINRRLCMISKLLR